MRLIDADELKDFILSLPKSENGYSKTYDESTIECFIDEQPTAYDVDKVIKQLKKASFVPGDRIGVSEVKIIMADKALDIVKAEKKE